jgi:hypothetical protein
VRFCFFSLSARHGGEIDANDASFADGEFGAMMDVSLVNDGPVTISESRSCFRLFVRDKH